MQGPPGIPGLPAGGDAEATQFIAPIPGGPAPGGSGPGMLPPENGQGSAQFPGAGQGSDAEATQFIAPVPAQNAQGGPSGGQFDIRPGAPEDRIPPAEFDGLFRPDAPGEQDGRRLHAADARLRRGRAAQQYGRQPAGHQQPAAQQQPAYEPQQRASYEPPGQGPQDPSGRAGGRRKSSRLPMIALGVVAIAVIGLGAGALMSGGDSKDDSAPASASSPTGDAQAQPGADPAKQQAEALDKLLADSNNSRSAVIGAVGSIKSCTNLDEAAGDLHGAAQQRRGLVTQLKSLTIDKLPGNGELAASLTKAWQASASADDHYAQWAKQAKSGKVCKGGKPHRTQAAAAGDKSSGDATLAKNQAAKLWNAIATKYGLTERPRSSCRRGRRGPGRCGFRPGTLPLSRLQSASRDRAQEVVSVLPRVEPTSTKPFFCGHQPPVADDLEGHVRIDDPREAPAPPACPGNASAASA